MLAKNPVNVFSRIVEKIASIPSKGCRVRKDFLLGGFKNLEMWLFLLYQQEMLGGKGTVLESNNEFSLPAVYLKGCWEFHRNKFDLHTAQADKENPSSLKILTPIAGCFSGSETAGYPASSSPRKIVTGKELLSFILSAGKVFLKGKYFLSCKTIFFCMEKQVISPKKAFHFREIA